VLVDGVDLSTVKLESYRTQLGVVLQETFLFDGTIRENVAFSRPTPAKRRFWRPAASRAWMNSPKRFEEKYDTIVGERGVKLSGGQRSASPSRAPFWPIRAS
jgi:ABC-type multidrug transport system fused ATPase/permease subunit